MTAWLLAHGLDPMELLFALLSATVMTLGISFALQLRGTR